MFYRWTINFSSAEPWRHPCLLFFFLLLFRSCPLRRSRLKAVQCPRRIPRSPVRRSPARARTCPATRSRRLRCLPPAQDPWLLPRPRLTSPSTGIPAGLQTRTAALGETQPRSVSASYPTTPPSGMWRKFTSSSVHCQVRGLNTLLCLFRKTLLNHQIQTFIVTPVLSVINFNVYFLLRCSCRLWGDSGRVSHSGDRRTGLAPVEGGPPHEHHEH